MRTLFSTGTLLLFVLGFATSASAEIRFSCSSGLSGTIREGFERHAFLVKADLQGIPLRGQGFITATGSRQFDLQSQSKKGTALSLQLSLGSEGYQAFSYLTVDQVRTRMVCGASKATAPGFARHSR